MTLDIQAPPRAEIRPARTTLRNVSKELGISVEMLSSPWALKRTWPSRQSETGAHASRSRDFPKPEMVGEFLDQVLDPEVSRIHPTWFLPAQPDNLPESLLDFLPQEISDRVRLLAGPTLVREDRLPKNLALELARALWSHLSPAKPVSQLGTRLWTLSTDRLEALLERAGVELAGSLLALVPERSAAALCSTLPPIQARTLWLARKTPALHASSSWIRSLGPFLARGASMQLIRRFSLALLTSALSSPPEDRDRVRRRLYRTWCPETQRDPTDDLAPLNEAVALFERLLNQEEASQTDPAASDAPE